MLIKEKRFYGECWKSKSFRTADCLKVINRIKMEIKNNCWWILYCTPLTIDDPIFVFRLCPADLQGCVQDFSEAQVTNTSRCLQNRKMTHRSVPTTLTSLTVLQITWYVSPHHLSTHSHIQYFTCKTIIRTFQHLQSHFINHTVHTIMCVCVQGCLSYFMCRFLSPLPAEQ